MDYFTTDGSSFAFEQLATAPSAAYDSNTNKTWQVWEAWDGTSKSVRVAVYDHAAQSWSQTYAVGNVSMQGDDHGIPALCRDSDGYWWCFYGPHNQAMQYSRSKNVDDPSSWLPQNVNADLPGNYTYPHPTFVGGKIYLFMRTYNSALNKFPLILRVGTVTSGSISWAAEQTILDWASSRVYQGNHILVGTEIQFVATTADAPDTTRKDVFVYRYDTATGNLINWAGTTTILPASLPSSLANSQVNFRIVDQTTATKEGFIPVWCYDTNGNAQIVYMDGPSGGPYNLLHAIAAPLGAWTTGTGVGSFSTGGSYNHRYDGYTIVPQASGGTLVLWPKSTSVVDRGSPTISARSRSSAGTWGSTTDYFTATGSLVLDGPIMVRGGTSAYRFAFAETTGLASVLPSNGAKAYARSDSGALQRTPASARTYLMETELFLNRLTVAPSSARAALYDAFIRGLKTDGIFDLLDAVYFHKCHDRQAARINVIRSGWDMTETDSANITFVTDSYIAGNGTSSRLYTPIPVPNTVQTNPNALTTGSILRYNLNSATVWGVTGNLGDAGTAFGFGDPTTFRIGVANINATQLITRLNRETPTTTVTLGTNGGVGFAGVTRTTNGTVFYNVNGTAGSTAQTATGLPTTGWGICGQANNSFSNRQLQATGFGGGLTAAQLELLRVRVNTLLTAF